MTTARGFTLIEMAVALVIVALLLSSFLVPLQTQVAQRKIFDSQNALNQINDALIGFALANGYLPCPDTTSGAGANDGIEDVNTGSCVAANNEGNVPWVTLGIPSTDAWGNFFHYRVTAAFAQRSPQPTFSLSSSGNLTVKCPAPACSPAYTYATTAPAVILSYGPNGWGAINANIGAANPAPTSTDELENTNGDAIFVSRIPSAVGSASGEFDDIVTWLSVPVLFNRMVAAGKLP